MKKRGPYRDEKLNGILFVVDPGHRLVKPAKNAHPSARVGYETRNTYHTVRAAVGRGKPATEELQMRTASAVLRSIKEYLENRFMSRPAFEEKWFQDLNFYFRSLEEAVKSHRLDLALVDVWNLGIVMGNISTNLVGGNVEESINAKRRQKVIAATAKPVNDKAYSRWLDLMALGHQKKEALTHALAENPGASREALKKRSQRR
jgi:hypothetical protein